jgi:hypothetical protein
MGIDEWSATLAHPMVIAECCDLVMVVPWASMIEVLPGDQSYGHYWVLWLGSRMMYHGHRWMKTYGLYWMMWLGNRSSMGIDEWSATKGRVLWLLLNIVTWIQIFHGHRWMKSYPSTSPMAITELGDLDTDVFHGHRWMKCYRGTSPIMAITECCDWETDVPWVSMNEVLPRD